MRVPSATARPDGGTEDAEAGDLTTIEHFPGDQAGLYGLADADIIRNQQSYGIELERHEEGDKLIGARLHGKPAERAKGAGTGTEAKAHGIPQQAAGDKIAEIGLSGGAEGGWGDLLQGGMDAGGFLNRAAQRTDDKEIIL